METIESLRAQRETVEEVRSVVRTMKGLAGSRIRHYEDAVASLEHYQRTVTAGLQILVQERPGTLLTGVPHEAGRAGAIVFGSDQGMCGSFNRRIAEHAVAHFDGAYARRDLLVAAVGRRAVVELEAAGQQVHEVIELPASVEGMTRAVRHVLIHIDRWRAEDDVRRVVLLHHQPVSRATYEPTIRTVVPIQSTRFEELRDRPWGGRSLPVRFGGWDEVFRSLVRQDLFVGLFRAFAESLASENGARLAAMQAAERNIDERAAELEQRYHRRRQETITNEVLDVISGWEALEG